MTYVARFTTDPTGDIERGWSAWMSDGWATEREALESIARMLPQYSDYTDTNPDLSDDEIVELLIDREEIDVRYHPTLKRWYHVHHDGLSCWPLDAESDEDALAEAQSAELEWSGFGATTVGAVRMVGHVTGDLYVFEAEEVTEE